MNEHHSLIIGGGFGGIQVALDLVKRGAAYVTLISQNPYFEYYPGLHKLLGVGHHAVVQIPLEDIFKNTPVKLIIDTVVNVNIHQKIVTTKNAEYRADSIVLALGSQTSFFGIAGLPEMSFGFKSYDEAVVLRRHIETMFEKHATTDKAETVVGLHIVIVGAGPNGVDLAGELATLTSQLSKKYGIVESLVTIDLIEAASRVLVMMPESVSKRVERRLTRLGVNVLCNRDLKQQESWTVNLADMTLGAKTVIWTAGVTSNELVTKIEGLTLAKKNRVIVDEFLQVKGTQNVFCIGDIADTPYSGLAQTAIYDGKYVAEVITAKVKQKKYASYKPKPNAFNIGVGRRWSVMQLGSFVMYGFIPYIARTLIDIKYFLSILPCKKVVQLLRRN